MTKSKLAVVSGPELAEYHFGKKHPFGPLRLDAFLSGMKAKQLMDDVSWLTPVKCNNDCLLSFHTQEYINKVKHCSDHGDGYIDYGDTPARKGIFEAASNVVGSVTTLIDQIMDKQYRRGFVPIAGLHHSYRDHCSGFCVFNDCAIAVERLRNKYKLNNILYVDIDAHHGDGVFYNYESDCDLYIVDFHEDGKFLYPGTGDVDETGTGPAKGYKMNFPMPMKAKDSDFFQQWAVAELFIRSIEPDFIILQCGADSMKGDPLTHLEYSTKSYQHVTESLVSIAEEFCEGRMIALGGGGYNMNNISKAWPVVVESMLVGL